MSYARFGSDSDVYVYASIRGGFDCCACSLSETWNYDDYDAILAHLLKHEEAGHIVPAACWRRLAEERDEARASAT